MRIQQIKAAYYEKLFRLRLNDRVIPLYKRVKLSYIVIKWLVDLGYNRKKSLKKVAQDMQIDSRAYGILLRHNPKHE